MSRDTSEVLKTGIEGEEASYMGASIVCPCIYLKEKIIIEKERETVICEKCSFFIDGICHSIARYSFQELKSMLVHLCLKSCQYDCVPERMILQTIEIIMKILFLYKIGEENRGNEDCWVEEKEWSNTELLGFIFDWRDIPDV